MENFTAFLILVISALHVYWGKGGLWPARDSESLARLILGGPPGTKVPGPWACYAVALALPAAYLLTPGLLGGVFIGRGLLGFFERRFRPAIIGSPYEYWSRVFYSPLCLLLGWLVVR